MKAVLRNRIYMEVTPSQQADIDSALTYSIAPRRPGDPPFIIKNMGVVRKGLITMPIGRTDLIPAGHEIVDKRVLLQLNHIRLDLHFAPPKKPYTAKCWTPAL